MNPVKAFRQLVTDRDLDLWSETAGLRSSLGGHLKAPMVHR